MHVEVSHSYFFNPHRPILRLEAVPGTEEMLRKSGLILRQVPGSIQILYDKYSADAVLQYLNRPIDQMLAFWIFIDDPYFYHYTHLPLNNRNQVLYLVNRRDERQREYKLHPGDFMTEQDMLPLRPPQFIYEPGSPKADIRLFNSLEVCLHQGQGQAGEPYEIDLRAYPPGRYRLTENGRTRETFVCLQYSSLKKPQGLIEIQLAGHVKFELISHLQVSESMPMYRHRICFESRYSYWRYFIVSRQNLDPKKIYIETGIPEVSFEGPGEVVLRNGTPAYLFQSEAPLSLKEISPFNFN
ncbi:MAG: hypothetical protein HC880_03040 [Bacteroidia bacterium]|nr:hypothetical protein [Bacteroidia bacterium]